MNIYLNYVDVVLVLPEDGAEMTPALGGGPLDQWSGPHMHPQDPGVGSLVVGKSFCTPPGPLVFEKALQSWLGGSLPGAAREPCPN